MRIIALEEGFITKKVTKYLDDTKIYKKIFEASSAVIGMDVTEAYLDLGDVRIAEMDKAGVDLQVLSFSAPQITDIETAIEMTTEANDKAAEAVKKYPSRFAAFAALPAIHPKAAVEEFERAITRLGFVGAMICGSINGEFLDDKKYWPILECAEAYKVPIYLHPYTPLPSLMETYFKDHEELSAPVWGFMVDASCHFMRLLAGGVFDNFPELKIILGHLGESIPYNLDRINNHLSGYTKEMKFKKNPADYIRDNLVITTSGNFSPQSVLCAMNTIGVDNILFSVDWPHESNKIAVDFLLHLPVSKTDLEKIAYKNAEMVLGLKSI